jgi:hypothetical protein
MTNGSNYKRVKIHYCPWQNDIHTPNQLNIPPARLSHQIQTEISKQMKRGANPTMWISSKQTCQINLPSDSNSDAICSSKSATISETISEAIPNLNSNTISESNSDHSHHSTLLQVGWLWRWLCEAVGEYLSSQYIAQLDISISRHICSKLVLVHNVCNYNSAVDSALRACDQ